MRNLLRVLYIQPWNSCSYKDARKLSKSLDGSMIPRAMFEVAWRVRAAGADVDLIDCNIEAFANPRQARSAVTAAISARIREGSAAGGGYDAVFVSWPTVAQGNIVRHVVETVRELTPALIVVGGGAVNLVRQDSYNQVPADLFYCGDGVEIAQILAASDRDFAGIPGVIGRNGEYLPPKRDLLDGYSATALYGVGGTFDFGAYVNRYLELGLKPIGLLEMMRGCPYRCSYCAIREELVGVRYRDPKTVADEAEFLLRAGIMDYYIIDPTFGLHRKKTARLLQFLTEFRLRYPDFGWWGITRCDYVTEDIALAFRSAGAHTMSIGVETMDQQKLDAVQKRSISAASERAIAALKQAGIKARLLLMHFPDSYDTRTIRFLADSRTDADIILQSSMMRPLYRVSGDDMKLDFRRWDQEADGRAAGLDTDASVLGWLVSNIAFPSTSIDGRGGDKSLQRRLRKIDLDLWFRAANADLKHFEPLDRLAVEFLRVGYTCDETQRKLASLSGISSGQARLTMLAVSGILREGSFPPRSGPAKWLGIVASIAPDRWYYYPRQRDSFSQLGFNIKLGEYLEDIDQLVSKETFRNIPIHLGDRCTA